MKAETEGPPLQGARTHFPCAGRSPVTLCTYILSSVWYACMPEMNWGEERELSMKLQTRPQHLDRFT